MSRVATALREWIRPDSIRRSFIPPMDGGLRANDLLDQATVMCAGEDLDPDDLIVRSDGAVVFTSGNALVTVEGADCRVVADVGGRAGALAELGDALVVAVEGHGLVRVGADGDVHDLCTDIVVRRCVTDMAVVGDQVLVTIGSDNLGSDEWSRGLLTDTEDGLLVRVNADGSSVVLAERLAWPAGIAVSGDEVFVSLSLDYAIERRALSDLGRPGKAFLRNLPAYPGRIRFGGDRVWVTAPYARNRMTEMFTDDRDMVQALLDRIHPDEWPVPRLRLDNPYRDLMQLGQLRVLGVLKPWAPPRSYGLVFTVDMNGLVRNSVHSRVDGRHHGVTGIALDAERVVLAVRGSRTVVTMDKGVLA